MTRKSLLKSLTEGEWLLLAETKRAAMADLDEDELLALHTRIRRPRTKYMSQYRRKGRAASTRTPIARKNVAATKSSGARRQAKRDNR